jgi:beta-mannosidase
MDLHDAWEFRRVGAAKWLPASIPGVVHLDLQAAGLIGDPFYRDNEYRQQWIEHEDWEYRTTFSVSQRHWEQRNHELIFEGLDTYATVRLNGIEVLESDNMFRTYEVDVGDALRIGENTLDVVFQSPIGVAMPLVEMLGYELPQGNDRATRPTRVFTRKAAYHFGWDWGARFVTSGVWRPARLRSWSGVHIVDLHVTQQSLTEQRAELLAVLEIVADTADSALVTINSGDRWFPKMQETVVLDSGPNRVALNFAIEAPQWWWPAGLGQQPLYEVIASVEASTARDEATRRIGLRNLEVVTEADSIGESFYVRVNGHPVFMKGANYIPIDHFTTRVDEARYRALFESTVAANINMLRIWGGGIYENDVFYDLADEYGVLIWQDFMFANGMYPGDSTFLTNVVQEAIDNVRRLRHHPSLALWCGNNEIDEAWHNWGWPRQYSAVQADSIWANYQRIFHDILPEAVATHDPGRFYWPSSPRIGWGHEESMAEGDSHYWGIWHGGAPFEAFQEKLPRFMSEFGFQGYPGIETVSAFSLPRDRALGSRVMQAHQKGTGALERIEAYMADWYRPPRDFESFLYVSQLLQAEGMKIGLVSHRRAMPRTMGTLYWQLNDTWPVASWSGIDYFGRWKALHYFTAKAFAGIIVAPLIREDTVEFHVVSDRLVPIAGRLEAAVLDFAGRDRWSIALPAGIEANASTRVLSTPLSWVLAGSDPSKAVLDVRFIVEEETVAEDLLYFAKPRDLALPRPEISVEIGAWDGGYRVVLESDVLAKNVYLSLEGGDGHFSDNYFDLLPGRVKIVDLQIDDENVDVRTQLRVRTLADTY